MPITKEERLLRAGQAYGKAVRALKASKLRARNAHAACYDADGQYCATPRKLARRDRVDATMAACVKRLNRASRELRAAALALEPTGST